MESQAATPPDATRNRELPKLPQPAQGPLPGEEPAVAFAWQPLALPRSRSYRRQEFPSARQRWLPAADETRAHTCPQESKSEWRSWRLHDYSSDQDACELPRR